MNFSKFFVLIMLFSYSFDAFAQTNKAIDIFKNDPQLKNASWSITILDINDDKPFVSYNSNLSLIPASTLKLVTTGIALNTLGSAFTFSTTLGHNGHIDNGVLIGDLIIKGFGDPTLGSNKWSKVPNLNSFLDQIGKDISKSDIKKITGNIIIDNSYIQDYYTTPSWLWEDLGNYYASGIWGVNINENMYEIGLNQNNQEGKEVTINHTNPVIEGLNLESHVVSGPKGSGDEAYVFGAPLQMNRTIKGTIPQGNGIFKIKGSIPNPPLFLGQKIKETILNKDVIFNGVIKVSQIETNPIQLKEYDSPTLVNIIKRANYTSNNLYCEGLFRAIGYRPDCNSNIENTLETIYQYFKDQNIDTDGLFLKDGSGLSPRNGITTYQLASLLKSFYLNNKTKTDFINSIKKENIPSKGVLYIKSGSMGKVRAYAGYFIDNNGQAKAFSIIVNNYNDKGRKMSKKMKSLVRALMKS